MYRRRVCCSLILVTCISLMCGCAFAPAPDLQRLYETGPLTRDTTVEAGVVETPVILVHGVFGARLRDRDTGKEIWPDGIISLLFNSYDDIALPIDADTLQPAASELEAPAITDRAAGRDFYGAIIRLRPREIVKRQPGVDYDKLMLEPGDGRVTKPSLFAREAFDPTVPRHRYSYFPMDHSILLCESHDNLTGNISFQNNLLNIC